MITTVEFTKEVTNFTFYPILLKKEYPTSAIKQSTFQCNLTYQTNMEDTKKTNKHNTVIA